MDRVRRLREAIVSTTPGPIAINDTIAQSLIAQALIYFEDQPGELLTTLRNAATTACPNWRNLWVIRPTVQLAIHGRLTRHFPTNNTPWEMI